MIIQFEDSILNYMWCFYLCQSFSLRAEEDTCEDIILHNFIEKTFQITSYLILFGVICTEAGAILTSVLKIRIFPSFFQETVSKNEYRKITLDIHHQCQISMSHTLHVLYGPVRMPKYIFLITHNVVSHKWFSLLHNQMRNPARDILPWLRTSLRFLLPDPSLITEIRLDSGLMS